MSFEEYFDEEFGIGEGFANMDEHKKTWDTAYNAGVTAERERCAKVVETRYCFDEGEEELIAAAIRRGE